MKLREFINHLEKLSKNGKNDNMSVELWDGESYFCDGNADTSEMGIPQINRFSVENDEYDYIIIHPKITYINTDIK